MNWTNVNFETSFGNVNQLKESTLSEVCFSGRSNVGKSSLINKLLGRKSIARVSSKPGKTVTINFYRLDDIRLVDLPGYGYAKVAYAEKERWSDLMEGYFNSGRNIKMVFQLIDMRHKPTDFDIDMLYFLKEMNIPFSVVLTKADKLNKTEFENSLELIKNELSELVLDEHIIPFSAISGLGVENLRNIIESVC